MDHTDEQEARLTVLEDRGCKVIGRDELVGGPVLELADASMVTVTPRGTLRQPSEAASMEIATRREAA